jgi:hypothetical protein
MNRNHLLVGGSFVAAILVAAIISGQQGPGFLRQWEYKVESVGRNATEMANGINQLAEQGWELVDIAGSVEQTTANSATTTTFIATFKRPEQPARRGGGRGGRGGFGRGAPQQEAENFPTKKEPLPSTEAIKKEPLPSTEATKKE